MSRQEREENLMIVAAAEEYGLRYHMPVKDVLSIFQQHHIAELLRSQYEVLHTMDLSEGAEEMAVISPFHGDAISIYRQENGRMRKVYEYEKPAEFSHAIFGGMIGEKPAVVIGHREGERNLLLFSWDQLSRQFQAQILDRGCGSANVYRFYNHGEAYLLSANRETDEAVLYQIRL